ncbi:MAG: Dabb family protein [Myxococcales bacterium]
MIKHVVMFKLHARSPENLERAVAAIGSLRKDIESIRALEIGADFAATSFSYDIVATVCFDDRSALEAYEKHPAHRVVLGVMRELSRAVAIVDYEC